MGIGCRLNAGQTSVAGPGAGSGGRPLAMIARAALLAAAVLIGAGWILLLTTWPGRQRARRGSWAVHHVSRLLLAALRVRLAQQGGPRSGSSLVVANHVSWLDVFVLAAAGPMIPVVQTEIARRPVIGLLCRRSGVLLLQRDRRRELPAGVDEIASALRRGLRVQVFPEATTPCGSAPNPFRRATFQAAIDAAVVVSPVAVAYLDVRARPAPAAHFVEDTSLFRSVLRILRAGQMTADVRWLPVIPATVAGGHPAADRARAAGAAERAIARTLRLADAVVQPPTLRVA
jgi:1-acyl-sn-glycerol-3-phosphate acyltransferase